MSRRSTGSYSSRYNQDSSDDLNDGNSFPLRSLARNRSTQSRINTQDVFTETQVNDGEFSSSPNTIKRGSGLGFWGSSSRKSRDSDGLDEDVERRNPSARRIDDHEDEYEGGYLNRGSVEQERLLRSSAGVEGAWAENTEGGHVQRPVSQDNSLYRIVIAYIISLSSHFSQRV
jgi:hypothetical protein